MNTFAQLMRDSRAARGLTFAQLAAEVGYHPSYLSLVERGLRLVDEEGVVRLAQVLGIDPSAALLAALRERLPQDLRGLVPAQIDNPNPETLHGASRQLQAEHFDFEIELLRLNATVDWDGNLRTVRTFEGCRPNAIGRPLWEICFRERVVGVEPDDEGYPKFAVRQAPAGLDYETSSDANQMWRQHRLFFPKGWRRSPHKREDSFAFAFETHQEKAFVLDASSALERAVAEGLQHPLRGCLSVHVPYFVSRLELTFDFPKGYQPERWESWVWWGSGAIGTVTRNLAGKGASRSFDLRSEGGHAELVADEPLAGYSFSLVWAPADRQRYLEARYGGSDEQH